MNIHRKPYLYKLRTNKNFTVYMLSIYWQVNEQCYADSFFSSPDSFDWRTKASVLLHFAGG
ncbi:hypothetical protein AU255_17970 [Methyloprofundus sedimenti]|uniref:Uncharacterized protein n=1 Tax=Methyloprofundus sedimenti TaxID=1420851 RepID=A0A1V8M1H4_9GAMM|nr:hypothetical protein AU255_17970 [Methyloprofundus sedimenti]